MERWPGRGEADAVARLGDELVRIPVPSRTLPPATHTNVFLVRGTRGWFVVDPGGHRDEDNALALAVLERIPREDGGGPGVRPRGLVLTHHHRDHIAGVAWWCARFPGLELVVHPRGPALLPGSWSGLDLRWQLAREVEHEGVGLLDTPGHASDHLSLLLPGGDLLCGDVVAGVGSILVNPPDGDMAAYLRTLARLESMDVRGLHPAHGPSPQEPGRLLADYRAHRLGRERRVVEAVLGGGGLGLGEIVAHGWPEVPVLVRPLARRAALAHLEKLRSEGRVWRDGRGRWHGGSGS